MRVRSMLLMLAVLAAAAPAGATHVGSGRPDCVSSVGTASAGAHPIADFKAHGFGGGFIANIPLPAVPSLVPAPATYEADVVGALLSLDFVGVIGGGTTTIRPIGGLPGASVVYSGAQRLTTGLFTGHFKAEPRYYECESVTRPRTIIQYSFFEITVHGLLTPLVAGSPLKPFASGLQVGIAPGNNAPL